MVSLPAYIGGARETEAVNFLGAIVSGSLVGIDMQIVPRAKTGSSSARISTTPTKAST